MPDTRRHRGPHPQDHELFAPKYHVALRRAVADFSWLLSHGYAEDSALKLVGDRHKLTARQRMAVWRSSCSDQTLADRLKRKISWTDCAGRRIAVDGYNLLITIESALAGGVIFVGRDGCTRDLASVHSTYRKVDETPIALDEIIRFLVQSGVTEVDWYLDKPVSNSGRLKTFMAETLESQNLHWNIELVNNPDAVLMDCPGPVVSSDSLVLDHCRHWCNLAAEIIATQIPHPWILSLQV